ncbi:MAG: hypothetical protein KDI30_10415 [Pseudomonadales bacterium]|nr:hypothetical protein [Pseudomonadales bacterium]
MKANRFFSILPALAVIFCFVPALTAYADEEIDATRFVPARYILSESDVVNSLQGSISAWPKSGYWVPDESLVNVFEMQIRQIITEESAVLRPFNEYTLQYVGLTKQGSKLILANAFCYFPPEYDISRQLYVVNGGGNCNFGALFDPLTSRIVGFSVNEGY